MKQTKEQFRVELTRELSLLGLDTQKSLSTHPELIDMLYEIIINEKSPADALREIFAEEELVIK
jgi:hypothetical protein